jgi:methyl-accepting chemotaxis protein
MFSRRSLMFKTVLGVGAMALLAVFTIVSIWLAADSNLGQLAEQQRRVLRRVQAESKGALARIQTTNKDAVRRAARASELLLRLDLRRSALSAAITAETLVKTVSLPAAKRSAAAESPNPRRHPVDSPVLRGYLRRLRFGRAGQGFVFIYDKAGSARVLFGRDPAIDGRALADEYPALSSHLRRVGWRRKAAAAEKSGTFLAGNRLMEMKVVKDGGQSRAFVVTPLGGTTAHFAAVADLESAQRAVLGDVRQALDEVTRAAVKSNRKVSKTIATLPGSLDRSLGDFKQSLLFVSLILLVLCVVVVAMAITYFRAGLVRPVKRLSALARSVRDGRYDERADISGAGDELDSLAASLNQMLDRLVGLIQSDADKQRLEADVMMLLELVSRAAEGDLTARAEVGSAEMASVTDALNHMLESIGKLVLQVRAAGAGVATAADRIRSASDTMLDGAASQAKLIADVTRQVKALGERSLEINRIVVLVEEIATQTNVLALNAAIEASRGGGEGRGFAAVAEEVRKLADRSTDATRDIGAFLQTLHRSADQVVDTMEQIASVASETTDGAEASTKVARKMAQATEALTESIARFRVRGADAKELDLELRSRYQAIEEQIGAVLELSALQGGVEPHLSDRAAELLGEMRRLLDPSAEEERSGGASA